MLGYTMRHLAASDIRCSPERKLALYNRENYDVEEVVNFIGYCLLTSELPLDLKGIALGAKLLE